MQDARERTGRLAAMLVDSRNRTLELVCDLSDEQMIVRRPAHLRELVSAESRYSWLERYIGWAEDTDGRDEYHAFLRKRFAPLAG
jgi:hypothetical protein